ncbi:hypothetical protein D0T84_00575 [Dysgonomonas sp. 521]|uniref:hypothetical protein n=1 Tax=Dysgonomonas sp. 521 TaxID=2302932 RepID=UPI0013D6442E|nr:hypothetical protein [Dysgonomonas sp. 521]NDV93412.1 hypothetical protein [Dysgonomonas sp. 521]
MEKFKMALLAVACLFMAGLNLWLEFKDWFDKNYQKKNSSKQSNEQGKDRDKLPSVIGQSKTVFYNKKEQEPKQDRAEEKKTETEENTPVHSMDLEKEKNPLSGYEGPVSSEDDIILYAGNDRTDVVHAKGQSFTVDEFGLLAKTLQGKPVTKDEQIQVAGTILKAQGTDLYNQFIKQVDGAENRAAAILRKANEVEENGNTSSVTIPNNLSKFIRR